MGGVNGILHHVIFSGLSNECILRQNNDSYRYLEDATILIVNSTVCCGAQRNLEPDQKSRRFPERLTCMRALRYVERSRNATSMPNKRRSQLIRWPV